MSEPSARRPVIGITMDAHDIAEYTRAVERAGGAPRHLLPDVDRVHVDLADLDGLVLSGGSDVDPQHFGQAPHVTTEPAADARDAYELALTRAAFEREVPTLAICRGVQIANVAFGGTLHQHLPDVASGIDHQPRVGDGPVFRGVIDQHTVAVERDSRLHRIGGDAFATGSRHHQAIDRIARGFHAVARTTDGVIEALEPDDAAFFWLGVQWHPESTLDLDAGASRALFAALIGAAAAAQAITR